MLPLSLALFTESVYIVAALVEDASPAFGDVSSLVGFAILI